MCKNLILPDRLCIPLPIPILWNPNKRPYTGFHHFKTHLTVPTTQLLNPMQQVRIGKKYNSCNLNWTISPGLFEWFTKFLKKKIVILATFCARCLLLKHAKELGHLIKSCILVNLLSFSFFYCCYYLQWWITNKCIKGRFDRVYVKRNGLCSQYVHAQIPSRLT